MSNGGTTDSILPKHITRVKSKGNQAGENKEGNMKICQRGRADMRTRGKEPERAEEEVQARPADLKSQLRMTGDNPNRRSMATTDAIPAMTTGGASGAAIIHKEIILRLRTRGTKERAALPEKRRKQRRS